MSPEVIALMTAITAALVIGILYAVMRNRRRPQLKLGASHLDDGVMPVGTEASVRRTLAPEGTVYARGEEWSARTADGTVLERGTPTRIVGHDGIVVIVERATSPSPGSGDTAPATDSPHPERTT